jgi:hypothetical protein
MVGLTGLVYNCGRLNRVLFILGQRRLIRVSVYPGPVKRGYTAVNSLKNCNRVVETPCGDPRRVQAADQESPQRGILRAPRRQCGHRPLSVHPPGGCGECGGSEETCRALHCLPASAAETATIVRYKRNLHHTYHTCIKLTHCRKASVMFQACFVIKAAFFGV